MTNPLPNMIQPPYQTSLLDPFGNVSPEWAEYFRQSQTSLDPLGSEKYFKLVNNQSTAANVDGLAFDSGKVSQATIDFLIQRVTTGTGAQEKIEAGTLYLIFKPTSNTWALSGGPSTAGITLSVTSAGQVQYTSTNLTGTELIEKITFRSRTLAAKHSSYSQVGL